MKNLHVCKKDSEHCDVLTPKTVQLGPSLQTKLAHVNESKMVALVVDKTAIDGRSTATWSFS